MADDAQLRPKQKISVVMRSPPCLADGPIHTPPNHTGGPRASAFDCLDCSISLGGYRSIRASINPWLVFMVVVLYCIRWPLFGQKKRFKSLKVLKSVTRHALLLQTRAI